MSAIFRIWTLCLAALAFSIPAHALQVSRAVAGDMANARFQHRATLLPSGKSAGDRRCCGTAATELFDPITSTWSAAASLQTGRGSAAVGGGTTGSIELFGNSLPDEIIRNGFETN